MKEPLKTDRKPSKVLKKEPSTYTTITCGTKNPASIGCVFYELESGEVAATFTAGELHEGHQGIMHGGLITSVLDEVMGRTNRKVEREGGRLEINYVSAEITTKYIKPILVGEPMVAYGWNEREEGRKRFNSGIIVNKDGEIMASATSVYVHVDIIDDKHVDPSSLDEGSRLTEDDPKYL